MTSLNTEMDIVTLTITAVLFLLITYYVYLAYWKYKDFPPGPYGIPLLGYAPFVGKKPYLTFNNLAKRYGNIFSVNLGGQQTVIANDLPSIREVLVKQGDTFSHRPFIYMFTVMFSSEENDIVSSSGPQQKELKRFTLQILKNIGMGSSSMENVIVEELEKLATHLKTRDGQLVDIRSTLFISILNVIWGTTSGVTSEINQPEMRSFAEALQTAHSLNNVGILNVFPSLRFVAPGLTGYTKFANACKKINAYIEQVVDKHFEEHNDNQQKTNFITPFIEEIKRRRKDNNEQPPYSKRHLVGAVKDMFYAGVDTINTTMHWALLLMAYHPDVQHKVQQELDGRIAADSHLGYSAKSTIPYTQATLCEVQRFASIASSALPHRSTKETKISGYRVPVGCAVIVNLWALNYKEEYWGDPEKFRPERFLDEEGRLKKHEPFIPFGAGPRGCPGESLAKMTLTLFFSTLMRRFSFEMDPNRPSSTSESPIEPIVGLILVPRCPSLVLKCR